MCRSRRGLSLASLARRAECSVSYLSMLERGDRQDPTLSAITKIAMALKVPLGILLFLAADKNDLAGIDKELADRLAGTALELLSESDDQPSLI
jgi:transcriptional regulator with XRE-family HTH domain